MCICFFQVGDGAYPFLFCGNRDEFFSRDSLALRRWPGGVLGGRDAVRGGMWLGVRPVESPARACRFAVVHNVRHSDVVDASTKESRGALVADFLAGSMSAAHYAVQVANAGERYMGFTLILVDETGAYFTSNRGAGAQKLSAGVYALSNALLNTPWPKVIVGTRLFRNATRDFLAFALATSRASAVALAALAPTEHHEHERRVIRRMLDEVLRNNALYPETLPGILDVDTEIYLSGIFIEPYKWKSFGFYGTRMQTLVLIRGDGSALIEEHVIDVLSSVRDWMGTWSTTTLDSRCLNPPDPSSKL